MGKSVHALPFPLALRVLRTLGVLLTLPVLLSACGPAEEISDAPLNLVVLTLDTVRADALGVYGQKLPTTPNIDAMAADGIVFRQAVTSAPSTFPSHSTLFTGKQPYVHGVRANAGYVLSEENVTLAEVLRAEGYRTGAEIAAPVLARSRHLDQGFEAYHDPVTMETGLERMDAGTADLRQNNRDAEDITEAGIEFIRAHRDSPFFLWLHYFDAHQTHDPPPEFRSRVAGSQYLAEVARIDHQLGRLIDEIEKLGLRSRTLVVVTADHGEGSGQHGEATHSFFVYDSTIRVPLIFWGPDLIPRGRQVDALVRLVDVMPTLLGLLKLEVPGGSQGVSLEPLLADPEVDLDLVAYGESVEPTTSFGSSVLRYVRQGRWKYIHKVDLELYDVEADPRELDNLAAEHPEIVERLQGLLEAMIREAPAKPGDAEVQMDEATLIQLQALGYVGGAAAEGLEDEVAALEVRGPDPATRVEDVRKLAMAYGQLLSEHADNAERLFREVVENNPGSPSPLDGLIKAVQAQGKDDESIVLLRRAIELDSPKSVEHAIRLAGILRQRNELIEAQVLLRGVLVADSCVVVARLHLAEIRRQEKDYAAQRAVLEDGPADCAGSVKVRNAIAYLLSTSPADDVRDGVRALELAQEAVRETGGQHPDYIDTLACAYAELGQFGAAQQQMRQVLVLLEGHKVPDELREVYERHLARVKAGEPIREP